jgi:uncharacterized protein YceK
MARRAVYTVLAVCVVWLSGCGTVANFSNKPGPSVYGALRPMLWCP